MVLTAATTKITVSSDVTPRGLMDDNIVPEENIAYVFSVEI
jgi:hypothetical protein